MFWKIWEFFSVTFVFLGMAACLLFGALAASTPGNDTYGEFSFASFGVFVLGMFGVFVVAGAED